MRIYPEKLSQTLDNPTLRLYWVAGDEPLLTQEACDTVRQKARQLGYTERKVFYADKKEHWQEAIAEANAMSLFAEKQLLDIRSSTGKIDHALLLEYLKNPNPDTLILLSTDKPEKSQQNTQWFKSMENACALVLIYPVDARKFVSWLTDRVRLKGLRLEPAALQHLAEHTEGNLLAAVQEIDKLLLLFGNASVSTEQLLASIGDNAHYEVFSLNDSLLGGHAAQAMKILHTLQQEGENPLAIIAALTRDLRTLANAAEDLAKGSPLAQALALPHWDKRAPLFGKALERLSANQMRQAIQQLAVIDQSVKGMGLRPAWEELERLCLHLCKSRPATRA